MTGTDRRGFTTVYLIVDLMLPRVAAGVRVTKKDLKKLGLGGLCLGCEACTWPNCGFGKNG